MSGAAPPGPTAPALLQTWRWMRGEPLALLEGHRRRYGDVFRLEILGPRYGSDAARWPLTRRTVVVFSAPAHVHEILVRSADGLSAGRAREFLEWFMGPRSLMVLDGKDHQEERRALLPMFTPERLRGYEQIMQRAAARALRDCQTGEGIDLPRLVESALEQVNLALSIGASPAAARLLALTRQARDSFSAPLLFVPLLRANLGSWSPGGRLAAFRRGLREEVAARVAGLPARPDPTDPCLLDALLDQPAGRESSQQQVDALVDRIITLLGGIDNTSAAINWTCRHLLRNPEALARVEAEILACPAGAVPGPQSFLEAACLESMRLNPPAPAVIRRVARTLSIGGFELAPGTFVLASMFLLQRDERVFPEPDSFRPDRFLNGSSRSSGFASFGAGARRCLGGDLALLQMRVLLTELFRRFEIRAEGPVALVEARRNVTVVPAGALRVTLLPRRSEPSSAGATLPEAAIRGPRLPAPIQSLLSMGKSFRFPIFCVRRYGEIYRLRLLLPRPPDRGPGWPIVTGSVVLVTSPAAVRDVFADTGDALSGGDGRRFTEWFLGPEALLVLDGEAHLQERRALLSLFTRERLAVCEELLRSATARSLGRLPTSGEISLASVVDDVAFVGAVQLLFGSVDEATCRRLAQLFKQGATAVGWKTALLLVSGLGGTVGRWSPRRRTAAIREEFRAILSERSAQLRSHQESPEPLLPLLMDLEDAADPTAHDRRLARVLTLLSATATTAGGLQWCCYHLLQNPQALALASAAVRRAPSLEAAARDPYLEAVCQEAIRLNPPVPILARRVRQPVTIAGYRLEVGTYLVPVIQLAHRRPELFPEPERFRPERFLERTFSPHEYFPFGGGLRRCIGGSIGFRHMTLVMAELLRRFDLEPLGQYRTGIRRVTVVALPRDPLRVAFRRVTP